MIVSPDESNDQILEILMETTVPLQYATDAEGQVVVNKLTLTNLDDEFPEESKANVVCKTTIGDKYARSVEQYEPAKDMTTFDGITDTSDALEPIYAVFSASDDYEQYATDDDGVETAFARCAVQIVLNEENREEIGDIFNAKYLGTLDVALAEYTVNNVWYAKAVASSEFKVFLAEPVYDESYDESFTNQELTD